MGKFIIRPRKLLRDRYDFSVLAPLTLESRPLESRPELLEKVESFLQGEDVFKDINLWIADNLKSSPKQEVRAASFPQPKILGLRVVEMTDEQAVQMYLDLPQVIVQADSPIELILPQTAHMSTGSFSDEQMWHLSAIGRLAGDTGTGKGINVAVCDTGIDSTHPEIANRVCSAYDVDAGSLRRIREAWDTDVGGHGTHVAGLIAGRNIGIAPEVRLSSVLVLPPGSGSIANLVLALQGIASIPETQIINISAGAEEPTDLLDATISDLEDLRILTVCAVGNRGSGKFMAPASCSSSIAVGAIGNDRRVMDFSGGGTLSASGGRSRTLPDMVAPGSNIRSSIPGGNYALKHGTSMAAPIVSGIAALVLEKYPRLTVAELRDILLGSCLDLGVARDRQGRGLVQII
jgi:subtilisin family serine protease